MDEERERRVNIQADPEHLAGTYANFANVSFSDYEFTITFARIDHETEGPDVPGVVVSRINMSHPFAKELLDALHRLVVEVLDREGDPEPPRSASAPRLLARRRSNSDASRRHLRRPRELSRPRSGVRRDRPRAAGRDLVPRRPRRLRARSRTGAAPRLPGAPRSRSAATTISPCSARSRSRRSRRTPPRPRAGRRGARRRRAQPISAGLAPVAATQGRASSTTQARATRSGTTCSREEAVFDSLALTTAPLVLVGHTHLPLALTQRGNSITGGLAPAGPRSSSETAAGC